MTCNIMLLLKLLTDITEHDGTSPDWWGFWIGFNDKYSEGDFVWTDETQVSIRFMYHVLTRLSSF